MNRLRIVVDEVRVLDPRDGSRVDVEAAIARHLADRFAEPATGTPPLLNRRGDGVERGPWRVVSDVIWARLEGHARDS
jgi:hypothetical protein